MPFFSWGSQKQTSKTLLSYDSWRKRYVREDGGGLYVLYNEDGSSSPKNAVTVSEASGWAMLAAVLADRRQDLEGFLRFYERFPNWNGLMCWQIVADQGKLIVNPDGGSGCATDGDLDAAYALLLAGRKWGSEDLRQKGLRICGLLLQHCINKRTWAPLVGDWVPPSQDPPQGSCPEAVDMFWATRPSDFCLTHFTVFAQEDAQHAQDWQRVADSCTRYLLSSMAHGSTGLLPDFGVWDAAAGSYRAPAGRVLEKDEDKLYFWNSCRVPWRLGAHVQSSQGESPLAPLLQRLAAFARSQDCIAAGYSLDGRPVVNYTDLAFLAPFWALLEAMGDAHAKVLRRHIKDRMKQTPGNYYGETVLLLCQLQVQDQQPGQCSAGDGPVAAV